MQRDCFDYRAVVKLPIEKYKVAKVQSGLCAGIASIYPHDQGPIGILFVRLYVFWLSFDLGKPMCSLRRQVIYFFLFLLRSNEVQGRRGIQFYPLSDRTVFVDLLNRATISGTRSERKYQKRDKESIQKNR